jgi:hypothetical protein
VDGITMFDSIANSAYPADPEAVAGYVDGVLADQPNAAWLAKNFPNAKQLTIALFPDHDADAADCENGAMTPADLPAWHSRQVKRGVQRPVIYASAWNMQAQVLPVLADADIARASVRLWTAHYTYSGHICGPSACGALDIDADGTQWTPNAVIDGQPRDLDRSLLLPSFFGVLPADWTYGPPLALSAAGGHESVRLEWEPPQGYPEPPAAYRVWIYKGTRADQSTLVPSYPREAVDGAVAWRGGGLELGKVYTAHVAAMGVDGTRMRPYGFAAAIFLTG